MSTKKKYKAFLVGGPFDGQRVFMSIIEIPENILRRHIFKDKTSVYKIDLSASKKRNLVYRWDPESTKE